MGFLAGVVWPLLILASIVTYIWLTVLAFKKSTGWGLAVLLLSPFAMIFYAIKFWDEAKKPFLIHMGSIAGIFVIFFMVVQSLGFFEMLSNANKLASGEISEDEIPNLIEAQLDRMENSGLMSEEDKAELEKMRTALRDQMEADSGKAAEPSGYDALSSSAFAASPPRDPLPPPVQVELEPVGWEETRDYGSRSNSGSDSLPLSVLVGGNVPIRKAGSFVGQPFAIEMKNGLEYKGRLAEVSGSTLVFEKFMSGGVVSLEIAKNEIDTLRLRRR